MSRRHFRALATALYNARPSTAQDDPKWRALVWKVADVCGELNPHFDRDLFLYWATTGGPAPKSKKGGSRAD